MNFIERQVRLFNKYQKRTRLVAIPIAVIKKYGDDGAGNLAALITYYGFLSLFPLLLAFFTITELIVQHNPQLKSKFISESVSFFPVIGQQIQNNIHTIHRSGLNLAISLIIIIYGARGVASSLQDASNTLWHVPKDMLPGFVPRTLRSLSIIVFGGLGIAVTTVISSYVTGLGHYGTFDRLFIFLLSFILNFGLLLLILRLSTASIVRTKYLLSGSLIVAAAWQVLQYLGSYLVLHELRNASTFYGIFALVLGLLFWIYLLAEVSLYGIELNVVLLKKQWPKDIINS